MLTRVLEIIPSWSLSSSWKTYSNAARFDSAYSAADLGSAVTLGGSFVERALEARPFS